MVNKNLVKKICKHPLINILKKTNTVSVDSITRLIAEELMREDKNIENIKKAMEDAKDLDTLEKIYSAAAPNIKGIPAVFGLYQARKDEIEKETTGLFNKFQKLKIDIEKAGKLEDVENLAARIKQISDSKLDQQYKTELSNIVKQKTASSEPSKKS